jgi:hypothetical protein
MSEPLIHLIKMINFEGREEKGAQHKRVYYNHMKIRISTLLFLLILAVEGNCQYPWNSPLKMAWSSDGVTFSAPTVFQDSSGVPSVIRWKGDTLIAAFQWFRLPNPSPSWDRVATKLSFDNGITWSQPTPINIVGLPANFQRPFDPTLTVFNSDSLRIYFSTSNGMPTGGLDSTIDTYSAKSNDGVNFIFEQAARVNELNNPVIDPAVVYFNNSWHYLAPIGSPQQGAYHYVSPNGLNFTKVPDIHSDNSHNWTGNYMVNDSNELRFYGCGGVGVWFNSTPNGGMWNGYVNTNMQGGDPSVLKVSANNYLMIFVGPPYVTGFSDKSDIENNIVVYPNPAKSEINVETDTDLAGSVYTMYDCTGKSVLTGKINSGNTVIQLVNLPSGNYLFSIGEDVKQTCKVIKE